MYLAITRKESNVKTMEMVKKVKFLARYRYEFTTFDNETYIIVIEHATAEDRDMVDVKKFNEEVAEKDLAYLNEFLKAGHSMDIFEREDGTFYFVQ